MNPQTIEKSEAPISLDLLAELVRDPALRQDWRSEQEPELGKLFDDAFLLIGGLKHASTWEIETLLDELGCHRRSREELEGLKASDLRHCIAFFDWLTALDRETPDVDATCELLRSASRMYGSLRRDVGEPESLTACQAAVAAPIQDDANSKFTSLDLIAIGEIGPAFQFAATRLSGKLGAKAQRLADDNQFSQLPPVHIRPMVIERLLRHRRRSDDPSLSSERLGRLVTHIETCDTCRAEYDAKARALGIERPLDLVLEPVVKLSD